MASMTDQSEDRARGVPPEIVADEAAKLRALFDEHTDFTQAEFGVKHGIGTQGAVWQYLSGKRPLNVNAADAFARGLHVPIESFSPRIMQEVRQKALMLAKLLSEHDDQDEVSVAPMVPQPVSHDPLRALTHEHRQPATIADALEVLGRYLNVVEADGREAAAVLLAAWAKDPGKRPGIAVMLEQVLRPHVANDRVNENYNDPVTPKGKRK
jgi:hypothetical protein